MRAVLTLRDFKIWVVTDGGAGFEVQAVGIAEALGERRYALLEPAQPLDNTRFRAV